MSANRFSPYIIGGTTSLISASDQGSGCFDKSLLGQLKVLLTIDCDTDQIMQEHLDKFNRHSQEGNAENTNLSLSTRDM